MLNEERVMCTRAEAVRLIARALPGSRMFVYINLSLELEDRLVPARIVSMQISVRLARELIEKAITDEMEDKGARVALNIVKRAQGHDYWIG